jgi:hypothetical protein
MQGGNMPTADGSFLEGDDDRTSLAALEFIEGTLVEAKQGAQKVHELMEEMRTYLYGFYAKRKAKEGIKVAEIELAEVIKKRKYFLVTALTAEIIASLSALAKLMIKDPLVKLVSDPGSLPLAAMTMCTRENMLHKVLVVTNRTPDFIVCNTLRNAEIWSPSGTLGLRAIIVEANVNGGSYEDVALGFLLVPPARFGRESAKSDGYVHVTLSKDGTIAFETFTYKIRRYAAVNHALGVIEADNLTESVHDKGDYPDHHLGFPGAWEYLTQNLDGLVDYLTDLAVLMNQRNYPAC